LTIKPDGTHDNHCNL